MSTLPVIDEQRLPERRRKQMLRMVQALSMRAIPDIAKDRTLAANLASVFQISPCRAARLVLLAYACGRVSGDPPAHIWAATKVAPQPGGKLR